MLEEFNPALAARLASPEVLESFRLFLDREQFINAEYFWNGEWVPFYQAAPGVEIARSCQSLLNVESPTLLLGVGLGYELKFLLRKARVPRWYAYERDLALLRVALTLHDFSAEMLSGRLRFLRQDELLLLGEGEVTRVVPGSVLFHRNKIEYLTIRRMIEFGEVASRRAVLLSGSELFSLDCADTLFDRGWDVFEVDPTILTARMTDEMLAALRPDLILKINLLAEIEQFCRHATVVEWEIDPTASPMRPVAAGSASRLFVFTHNPERTDQFRAAGHRHVRYLPLCANPKRLSRVAARSEREERFACNLSFVGSLMRRNQQRLLTDLLGKLRALVADGQQDWGPVIGWIERLLSHPPVVTKQDRTVETLTQILKSNDLPEMVEIDGAEYLVVSPVEEFLAYLWRKQMVTALLPFQPRLWGDSDWRDDFPDHYCGIADHYLEVPHIYQASKINLDISRLYQPNVVTMRVFDVLACGGFVLADRNAALLELFREDEEIVCYDTQEEAVEKVRFYLAHKTLREK
ncbi:MAG: hypothetical protein D6743_15425, partial [Calditrichaeota bacterium]